MIVACLAVTVVFTSCGGKGLSGTYIGYVGTKTTITFSGNNKIKIDQGEWGVREGIFELVEEYKDDDFSRGSMIITYRDNGKDEWSYKLEGKKGEILTIGREEVFIKDGKSVKIPGGTYSYEYGSFSFSGNNLTIVNNRGDISEHSYEFIIGYEEKGISKGYLLIRGSELGESAARCDLEKDKLTFGSGEVLQKSK